MSRTNVDRVNKLLEDLREDPTLFTINDTVLQPIWDYLVNIPRVGGEKHWFCALANDTTIEAATFLLRLLSFSSVAVIKWKESLHECLSHCVGCVHGCEVAKIRSRSTYLSNYMSETLDAFFSSFDEMELAQVLGDIDCASKNGASVHDAVLYRMITNWHIFTDRVVLDYLYCYPPTSITDGWPQPLGPGLLVLLISEDASLRQWAQGHASRGRIIGPNDFTRSHNMALSLVLWTLKGSEGQAPVKVLPPMATKSQLWSGVYDILRLVPPEWFQTDLGLEMKRVILSNLSTQEAEFQSIFKSFILLSKRLGANLWSGEGSEYPGGIFDAIVQNHYYSTQLQALGQSDAGSFYLSWFQEYLATLRGSSDYDTILNKVINFFCEDTQTESFEQIRPAVIKTALTTLKSEIKRSTADDDHRKVVSDILELHSKAITDVVFNRKYKGAQWQGARELARSFLQETIYEDIDSIRKVIHDISPILGQRKIDKAKQVTLPTLVFRKKIWPALYTALQANISLDAQDVKAISGIISLVAKVSHLAKIQTSVYTDYWGDLPAGNVLLEEINKSLSAIHEGFSAVVSTFSEYGNSTNGINLLQCDGVSKAAMMLLLSPVQEFETAGKTLIGLAFDVDGRADCIRAMLENLPVESFDGMFEFLERFEKYATLMPEACTLSATLVLCSADVLEALCASPGGLIHNSYFLRPKEDNGPSARLPLFWKRLNAALTVIYKRTPMWAEVMEAADMVTWMRDAMILARDALGQWRVIEQAANTYHKEAGKQSKVAKVSAIGKQMINSLQTFMPEVVRWLRLTDEELLYQSFSLLESLLDLMKDTDVQPNEIVLTKCLKYVRGKSLTKLDEGRLARLSEKLAYFEEDGIEIIEHKPAPEESIVSSKGDIPTTQSRPTPPIPLSSVSASKGKTKAPEPPKAHNYIQGRASVSGGTSSKIKLQKPLPFKSSAIVYDSDDDKASSGSKFTDKDKQRLAMATAATRPSFRKTATSSTGPVSRPSKPSDTAVIPPRKPGELKNEAHSGASMSEATESKASDSESDEDDIPNLANYGKVKSPSKPKPVIRRQIKTMDIPTRAVLATRRPKERNWADLQSERIKPDISALHKIILSWKYDHDGPLPPGPPLTPCRVPQRFKDYDHYFRVFQPLLLYEAWEQFCGAKEEQQESFQCKVESRHYNGDFAQIDMTIPESVTPGWYLSETDVVLLKQHGNSKCAIAKVKSYRAFQGGIQLAVSCYCPGGSGDPGLQVTTLWQISKLFSLSTLNREYAALISLQFNKMQSFIFNPSLPHASEVDLKALQQVMHQYKVNEPQAAAILKALDTDGFSLIQGPPGTGKTSTITGLISKFLSKKSTAPVGITAGQARNEAPPPRVLVCAPSNAAVNELVQRLQAANIHATNRGITASIVRIGTGTEDSVSDTVRDCFLDNLVQGKLGAVTKPPLGDIANGISAIYDELAALKAQRIAIQQEFDASTGSRQAYLQNQKKELFAKKELLGTKLDKEKARRKDEGRTFDTARRNARLEVLKGADIICTTLSGTGHDSIDMLSFDIIVVDEAAQSIELSSLIPLRFGCSRVVMVGDPQQLPPTVKSKEATKHGYNESLFVRLQRSRPDAVHLLSIQYRMHPDISCLPSRIFYDNKLLDGPDMATKTLQPWHATKQFGTYKFFNVSGVEEIANGHSLKNTAECVMATELFKALSQHFKSVDFNCRIGVISMYNAQITALRKTFTSKFGRDVTNKIQFGTVDGFQGQEKDIIILSCVRSGTRSNNIGFLTDVRRVNVALTRAKSSLFILGNAPTLERSDKTWAEIVKDAKTRSTFVDVNTQYFARPPSPENVDASQPLMKKRKIAGKPDSQPPIPNLLTPREFKSANVASSTPSNTLPTGNESRQTSSSSAVPAVPQAKATTYMNPTSNKRTNDGINDPSAITTPVPAPAQQGPSTIQENAGRTAGPSSARNPGAASAPGQHPRPAPLKKRKNAPTMDLFIPKKKK